MYRPVFALLAASILAACGGEPATAPAEGGAAEESLQIAVIPKGLAHQFWLTVKAGAEAAANEAGASIIWQGPSKETEVVKQLDIVTDMINRKVDGIVLAACDENALVSTVDRAAGAGIPVITIDSGVQSETPLSFVATDNAEGARAAARTLAGLIGEEGEVGIIPFVAGAATSEMRVKGFREGIAAFPGIQVVAESHCNSDVARAMDVTQDMLTAHPNLKGIFAANEPGAMGAAQAIRAAGKTDQVAVVAFDASEEEIAALKEGVLKALIVQNPFKMGYLGVQAALDAIAGKTVEKRIDTGVAVVTMDNFSDPEIQKILYPLDTP